MRLAQPVAIDVVVHHDVQLQSCASVVAELARTHQCNILVGQDAKPTGAPVAILVDHCAFQPRVTKKNYKYLIHMSHDLADFNTYADERQGLDGVDLFLVPGAMHAGTAGKVFPATPVHQIGWPKFDLEPKEAPAQYRPSGPDQKVVIYAPTYLHTREWEELLPALLETGHLILIKNHVYYNFEAGDAPPQGCEEEYALAIQSLLEMEAWLKASNLRNFVYVDRRSNLCDLFTHADLLVTDSSSCAIEFLPFGPCIETGRFGPSKAEIAPNCSRYADAALYLPVDALLPKLATAGWLAQAADAGKGSDKKPARRFIYEPPARASAYAAELIDVHLFLWQNKLRVEGVGYLKNARAVMTAARTIKNQIKNRLMRR